MERSVVANTMRTKAAENTRPCLKKVNGALLAVETRYILKHTLQEEWTTHGKNRHLVNMATQCRAKMHLFEETYPNSQLYHAKHISHHLPNCRCFVQLPSTHWHIQCGSWVQTNRNTLTNLHTNISINLSVRQPIVGIGENVRHSNVLPLVLAVFAETLPCDHDWYRRFGNKIITEGSKQDAATVNIMQNSTPRTYLPLQCVAASGPKDYESRFKEVDLYYLSGVRLSINYVEQLTTSVIICLGLLQWKTSTTARTCSLVFRSNLTHRSDTSTHAWYLSFSALPIAATFASVAMMELANGEGETPDLVVGIPSWLDRVLFRWSDSSLPVVP
jgi:hypothetical protein